MHSVCPEFRLYIPFGHEMQDEDEFAPVFGLYVPGPQLVTKSLPMQCAPVGHAAHCCCCVVFFHCPGVQVDADTPLQAQQQDHTMKMVMKMEYRRLNDMTSIIFSCSFLSGSLFRFLF